MKTTTKNKSILCVAAVLLMILIAGLLVPMTAYAADNTLRITVSQIFETSSSSTEAVFKYKLTPLESGNPMPSGSTEEGYVFTVTGNSSAEIGPINYSQPDIYSYELCQVIETEKPGFSYDKRVYTLDVYVDAELHISLIVKNRDGNKTDRIVFENGYSVSPSDPALMVDPPVRKTIIGNPYKDSMFKFRLTAQNISNPMPAGSLNGVKEIVITGTGEKEFGKWSYDKEGVYVYTVSEVNSGEKNYTYDMTVYTITDTVKDENGQLVLSRVVTNNSNQQTASLAFVNKYSVDEGKPGPITGDDIKTALYYFLFALGGTAAVGATIYLIAGKRRKKDDCHENQ